MLGYNFNNNISGGQLKIMTIELLHKFANFYLIPFFKGFHTKLNNYVSKCYSRKFFKALKKVITLTNKNRKFSYEKSKIQRNDCDMLKKN